MRRAGGRHRRIGRWLTRPVIGALAGALLAGPAWGAALPRPRSMGILYVEKEVIRPYTDDYHQREAYLVWSLRLPRALGGGGRLRAGLEATLGRIADRGGHAFTWSAGPRLSLATLKGRVVLHAGVRPTYLSNYRIGPLNLGTHLQFTSHVGVLVRLFGHLTAGWRFQHVSNAGLATPNPGITLSTLDVGLAW